MSNAKKLFEAAAGTAAAGGSSLDVADVFSTYLYNGTGSTGQQIENGLKLGADLAGPYTRFSVLDTAGVGGYLYRSSDLTNNSNSKTLTFSVWAQATNNNTLRLYNMQSSRDSGPQVQFFISGFMFRIQAVNASNSTIFDTGYKAIVPGLWTHYLVSVDLANTSNRYLYINDVQILGPSSSWTTYTNDLMDFTSSHHYVNAYRSTNNNGVETGGGLAQLFLDYTYRDLSQASNRRTFSNANKTPVSNSTLSALNPILYLPFDYENSAATNLGTGGNFVAYNPTYIEAEKIGGPGIDSDGGAGGLVWVKSRSSTADGHRLYDTVRGVGKVLQSQSTAGQSSDGSTSTIASFNSNGFSIPINAYAADADKTYVSFSFRKAEKFFDIQQFTGNGTAGRTLSHNLGSVPGMVIVKPLTTGEWSVYHRGMDSSSPEDYYLQLDKTAAKIDDATRWNDTAPTSTVITLGNNIRVNENGEPFVAYFFAHNDGDGDFGSAGDQDIISCGTFTTSGETDITLGWEPQYVLIKSVTSGSGGWFIWDTMRGWQNGNIGNNNDPYLYADLTSAEAGFNGVDVGFPTATGFRVESFGSGIYIYMAVRAEMIKEPEAATEVFDVTLRSATSAYSVGFPTDLWVGKETTRANGSFVSDRLRGETKYLLTPTSGMAQTDSGGIATFDLQNSFSQGAASQALVNWNWKRAKGYHDSVCFTGNGTAGRTVAHSLGVVPEMMWVKKRVGGTARGWYVYHAGNAGQGSGAAYGYNLLDSNDNFTDATFAWNNTAPTSSVFSLGNLGTNDNNNTYIAHLFATVAGVSKVGVVSHSGTSTDVDCGFSNGARFFILKRTNTTGDWYVYDSTRGLVAGAGNPYIFLNTSAAQVSGTYLVDPLASGFKILDGMADGTYIFYAIA